MKPSVFLIFALFLLGCQTSKNIPDSFVGFKTAMSNFDKQFPRQWPPKALTYPLTNQDKNTLKQTTDAVAQRLSEMNTTFARENDFKIVVLPEGISTLGKYAAQLKSRGVSLSYDAEYFAANPFSAGTYLDQDQKLLFSHVVLNDNQGVQDLIEHELIHVETNWNLKNKKPSLFYCKFKGKQFEPHYLSCDEMNAYSRDIERLKARSAGPEAIKSKAQPAKMHTEPIIELIDQLDVSSFEVDADSVLIPGKNKEGDYTMEIPSFVIGQNSQKITLTKVKKHLAAVRSTAKALVSKFPQFE